MPDWWRRPKATQNIDCPNRAILINNKLGLAERNIKRLKGKRMKPWDRKMALDELHLLVKEIRAEYQELLSEAGL
jgi:hypothetical protein